MKSVAQMIDLLNGDLANEYKHMHFYLNAAIRVQGLHRAELREMLFSEAKSEMKHVQEFADLIVGLGGIPSTAIKGFRSDLTRPKDILQYAQDMENEVVANYIQRQKDAQELGGVEGRWIDVFLDDQIIHSREDADNMKQMIAGL